MNSLESLVEGLIFLSGEEGLTFEQLRKSLPDTSPDAIQTAIDTLREDCESDHRGIRLVEYAERFKYVTKESVYPYAQALFENIKVPTLSQAALETLAIIAYKQPITRVEIEEIRGVNCEMMLKKLQARGLIETGERLDTVGKPLLYHVTDAFLDGFQLNTLQELPELPVIESEDDLFSREDS